MKVSAVFALLGLAVGVSGLQAPLSPRYLDVPSFPNCSPGAPLAAFAICNPAAPLSERVSSLLGQMNITEKISWLGDWSAPIERLGIPVYEWWSEALHGVAYSPGTDFGGPIPSATSFPEPIGLGSSFDRQLVGHVAAVISTEARAMNNLGQAGITFFTPNINVFRDPRWGRGQETPGEDPYLTSEYVYALVNGLQVGEDPRYLKVVSNAKHYIAYDLEIWHGVDRFHFNAIVADLDLMESYLPAFETSVRDARAASIMCSYNAMNGVPSCGNDFALQTILRDSYSFDGFVVTDCGALDAMEYSHNYTSSPEETVAVALHAGVDLNCGLFLQNNSVAALASGAIVESDIDRALTNSLSVLVRTGWFDPADDQPYRQLGPESVNTQEAQELALKAALEGFVLLQNSGPMPLPWNVSAIGTVAVLGPLRNATDVMQGNYNGRAPFLVDPITALETVGVTVVGSMGMNNVTTTDTSGFAAALASISNADAVIYIGGLDQSVESEGNDRTEISMPGVQEEFLAQILLATQEKGIQLVTVILSGGQVDLSVVKSASSSTRDDGELSPEASEGSSILWVGYPGQSGGTAIAMTLFGLKGTSPAGRLPLTQYPSNYTDQVSMFDMSFRPSAENPGRTYKFFPADQAVFEFGQGLSYTEFLYTWGGESMLRKVHSGMNQEDGVEEFSIDSLAAVHSVDRLAVALTYRVNVTNIRSLSSDVVVLLFLLPSSSEIASALLDQTPVPPNKQLVGFERLQMVAPGETQDVFFPLQARQLTRVDEAGEKWLRPGEYHFGVDVPTKRQWTIRLTGQPRKLE